MWCNVELGTNLKFALVPRKTTENPDRIGWSQDLTDAYWLTVISPAFKYWDLNGRLIDLFETIYRLIYRGEAYINNI
jgi:hypothetical protein